VVGQEEGLLVFTEIALSSEYESESEASTNSFSLPSYISSPSTIPLLSPSPIDFPSSYNSNNTNLSQLDINQLLEQMRM